MWSPLRPVLEHPWGRATVEVARDLAREWQRDRVTGLAAEMSFFALLAVFPMLLALAAALGSLEVIIGADAAGRAEDAVIEVLERNLTEEGADIVEGARRLFAEGSPGLLTFGLLATLWAGSRGFVGVINALDTAYDVEERRGWVGLRAMALLLSLGTVAVATLLLVVMVLGPLLGTGREVAEAIGAGGAFARTWDLVRQPVAFAVVVAWAATVFHVGPNHASPWRWDLPGAALTGVLWIATSVGFRAYLAVAGEGGNLFLGALGGTLVLVLWLYALSIALLVGAELNAVLTRRARVVQQPDPGP
jgi:membrane protein